MDMNKMKGGGYPKQQQQQQQQQQSAEEKHKKKQMHRWMKKLGYRALPPVTVHQEGSIFGEAGCLKLVRTAKMGLGVVTTKDVAAGTIILRESPLAAALMINPATTNKLHCLLKIAAYNPTAKTLYSSLVTPMMFRGVTKEWLDNFVSVPTVTWDKQMISALVDVVKAVHQKDPSLDIGEIRALAAQALGVVKANAFMNTSPITGVLYATSLYNKTTFINHSCQANAIQYNDGSINTLDFIVLAKQAIPKGSEVFICYGNARVKKVVYRRDSLKRTFGFNCECERCLKEVAIAEIDPDSQNFSCDEVLWETYNTAAALSAKGRTQAAYNIYCDMVMHQRKALEISDPDIRILIAYNCSLLYFQWESHPRSNVLTLECLEYLGKEVAEGTRYHKNDGPVSNQFTAALSSVMEAIRCRLVLLEVIRANVKPTGTGTSFDSSPPEMMRFFLATQRMISAYDRMYGHLNYKFDMDMELSHAFENMMKSLDICMQGFQQAAAAAKKSEEELKEEKGKQKQEEFV